MPQEKDLIQGFLSELELFWIHNFPSPRPIAIDNWRGNSWIYIFPKGISAMWNAKKQALVGWLLVC